MYDGRIRYVLDNTNYRIVGDVAHEHSKSSKSKYTISVQTKEGEGALATYYMYITGEELYKDPEELHSGIVEIFYCVRYSRMISLLYNKVRGYKSVVDCDIKLLLDHETYEFLKSQSRGV